MNLSLSVYRDTTVIGSLENFVVMRDGVGQSSAACDGKATKDGVKGIQI